MLAKSSGCPDAKAFLQKVGLGPLLSDERVAPLHSSHQPEGSVFI
jgi:hypothetical protein